MAKITKKATQESTLSAFKAPWLLAFQYLGARLQKYLPYFTDLGSSMQKAGLKISLHAYVSLMALLSAISFAAGFSATLVVALVFAIPILLTILFAFGVSILSGDLVFGVLYSLPSFLATSRRRRMDLELPYVTTHMSILAAAGMPPARMFKLLEDSRTTPEVASEANEVVRDVEILGDDIITALEAERKRSPSSVFAEILEGLVATIRSGGNMKGYLQDSTRMMMDLRRVAAKQMIESLATFAGYLRDTVDRISVAHHRNVLSHGTHWRGHRRYLSYHNDVAGNLRNCSAFSRCRSGHAGFYARGGLKIQKSNLRRSK